MLPTKLSNRLDKLEQHLDRYEPSTRPDFRADTFPEQRAFIDDQSPLVSAKCTRRAAKSYSAGLDLMETAYEHEGSCLYIGKTRESAKRIMWRDVMQDINRKRNAGFKFHPGALVAESPNGSPIYLLGMDSNEDEKTKALGQKFRKVYIDEAQAFTIDLEELIFQILKPAVADYRGQIRVIGTPGNLVKSYYYNLTTGKVPGWSHHEWTTYQNPYMKEQWDAEIKDLIARNPLVIETPWFRQQYRNEWVIENDKLVYRFNPDRNVIDKLPEYGPFGWSRILGVDLGYNDPTAFMVWGYHEHDKTLYGLEGTKAGGLDISDVANRIKFYQEKYKPDVIVIDGSNKQAVEEIRRRHQIPVRAADKREKADFIELMNADLIQGNIKLLSGQCDDLVDEYLGLIWDERKARKLEHPSCPNHLADAGLYGWRYCYQYLSEKPDPPKPEDVRLEEFAEQQFEKQIADMGYSKGGVGDSSGWEWWANQ